MTIYINTMAISQSLNMEDLLIDDVINEDCYEPIPHGWNDSKTFRKAVSLGMEQYHTTEEAKSQRIRNSIIMRNNERCISRGNFGNKHTENAKKMQRIGGGRRMSSEEKSKAIIMYNKNIGVKAIAKEIGFSAQAIRKLIKAQVSVSKTLS